MEFDVDEYIQRIENLENFMKVSQSALFHLRVADAILKIAVKRNVNLRSIMNFLVR